MTSDRRALVRLITSAAWCGLLVLNAASIGCKKEEAFQFNHTVHAELGVACADCHAVAGKRPELDTCKTCHSEALESVTPEQVASIMNSKKEAPATYGLIFDHEKHSGLNCSDCHQAKGKSMARPTMASCMDACHGPAATTPMNCAACHSELDPVGKPKNHSAGWTTAHGRSAEKTCKSCHEEETCFSCHKTTSPANHNQHWRLRGHGVTAEADRERCLSCHRQDECTTCHLQTQPISHTNAWTGSVDRHCVNCHLPLTANNCTTCHAAAKHTSAPGWPIGQTHVTGATCRTCHSGPGAGLNHPDNGDNCETCHAR